MDYKASYSERRAAAIRSLRLLKDKLKRAYAVGTTQDQMKLEQRIFFIENEYNL